MDIVKKNTFYRWIMPFFLGVVMFNVLRAITDLTKDGVFWSGSISQHVVSQLVVIFVSYVFDYVWYRRLQKEMHDFAKRKLLLGSEYLKLFLSLFININLIIFIGEKSGILYMGNGLIDYMLANVVFIPIFLLYYTMIRSDMVNKYFTEQALLFEKIRNENLDTELKYLKAQYHPHFLFNALNTIYFQTKEEKAKQSIELLSELLRYQLYNVNKIVTIRQEIDFIKFYIAFQRQRMNKRLVFLDDYDPRLNEQIINPLLFQPLLENAFKYVRGEYRIFLSIKLEGDKIHFSIENSIETVPEEETGKKQGIGIENLKRRLELLYPQAYSLTLQENENSYSADLIIQYGKE